MIVQDKEKWKVEVYASNIEDVKIINSKDYEGYDLKLVIRKFIPLDDMTGMLEKFCDVSIYFDYIMTEEQLIKSLIVAKEIVHLGGKVYYRKSESEWKEVKIQVRYRVLSNCILIRTQSEEITLDLREGMELFNKALSIMEYSELEDEEKQFADFFIEHGIFKKYGNYMLNISYRVRKDINTDWE